MSQRRGKNGGPAALVGDARFDTAGGTLPNTGATFALVLSNSPLTEGTDYDTNDDGVLDLPAGAQILDAVGWTPSGNNQTDLICVDGNGAVNQTDLIAFRINFGKTA